MAEQYVVDNDYLVGPRRLKVRSLRDRVAQLVPEAKAYWHPGKFAFRYLHLEVDDFEKLRRVFPRQGLPIDLLHHARDIYEPPRSDKSISDRVKQSLAVDVSMSPRQRARKHFDDRRSIQQAQAAYRLEKLNKDEVAAFGRVTAFEETQQKQLTLARQLRFIHVGLELAEDDEETAQIVAGPLQNAVTSISVLSELDEVETELLVSPQLSQACRYLADIEHARWDTDISERWSSIVSRS